MADSERISYLPSEGLSYDPNEPKYWDTSALGKEITRAFEICHGCRLCFKYCDSFPTLFSLVDNQHGGDVRKLDASETDSVLSACFQCKLCEVQCPYTPREGHEFQLDFPKLVHRYKAVAARKNGIPLREKVLGDPDLAGRMARMSGGTANAMNRVAIHRWFMEKFLGIHRKKLLPDFVKTTFEKWALREGLIQRDRGGEAVLFQTCYVQNNEPEIGRDTIEVLRKNQVDIRCEKGLACCGMPKWESGDLKGLRAQARQVMKKLLPFVERGAKVIAINPTCSMMLKKEYPLLVEAEDREAAKKLSQAVMDPGEFLWSIRDEKRFNTEIKSKPGNHFAYHAPCHLRAQGSGFRSRDLLRKLLGISPTSVIECCGHDGTFAMKKEGFEASIRIGEKAFSGMKAADSELWVTDCPLAALQFKQHAGRKPMHPMSVLARAYREKGFEKP